jgi:hypothetical protein
LQPRIFRSSVAKADVSAPDTANPSKRPRSRALDRRERLDRPVADQANVVFALDLECKQQHLHENQSGEEAQRAMTRNDRIGHIVEARDWKLENC